MCLQGVFMASVRLQTTLPEEDMSFISSYKKLHKNYKSDSSVISYAINLLKELELKKQYMDANSEIDYELYALDFDGLTTEDW